MFVVPRLFGDSHGLFVVSSSQLPPSPARPHLLLSVSTMCRQVLLQVFIFFINHSKTLRALFTWSVDVHDLRDYRQVIFTTFFAVQSHISASEFLLSKYLMCATSPTICHEFF